AIMCCCIWPVTDTPVAVGLRDKPAESALVMGFAPCCKAGNHRKRWRSHWVLNRVDVAFACDALVAAGPTGEVRRSRGASRGRPILSAHLPRFAAPIGELDRPGLASGRLQRGNQPQTILRRDDEHQKAAP